MNETANENARNFKHWLFCAQKKRGRSLPSYAEKKTKVIAEEVRVSKECEKTNKNSEQIGKDIFRTFPNDLRFQPEGAMTEMLRECLLVLSADFECGYAQGWNYLCAFVMKCCAEEGEDFGDFEDRGDYGLSVVERRSKGEVVEESCYLVVKHVIDEVIGEKYFDLQLSALKKDLDFLDVACEKMFKELYERLSKCGMSVHHVCPKWFICMFVGVLPDAIVKVIWDELFLVSDGMLCVFALTCLSFVDLNNDANENREDDDCESMVLAIRDALQSIKCADSFMRRFSEIREKMKAITSTTIITTKTTKSSGIKKTKKRTRPEEEGQKIEEDVENDDDVIATPTHTTPGKKRSRVVNEIMRVVIQPPDSAVKRVLTPIGNFFVNAFATTTHHASASPLPAAPAATIEKKNEVAKTPQTNSRLNQTMTKYVISTNKKRRFDTVRNFETPIDDPEGYERDLLDLLRAEEHTPLRKITNKFGHGDDDQSCDTIPTMAVGFFSPRAAKELHGAKKLNSTNNKSPLMGFR